MKWMGQENLAEGQEGLLGFSQFPQQLFLPLPLHVVTLWQGQ